MDAVEFLKQFNRMCKAYNDDGCKECPAHRYRCGEEFDEQEEDGVSIVEQWAKEHPIKTRQSEFLKMFPNAQKSSNGVLDICPRKFEPEKYKSATPDKVCINCDTVHWCDECCRDFWLKEIE
nr:MAG TPA: hypothetical protein [Caudoviricetes sp.]